MYDFTGINLISHLLICNSIIINSFQRMIFNKGQNLTCFTDFDLQ